MSSPYLQWSALATVLVALVCLSTGGFATPAHGNYPFKFTPAQRNTADKIISVFENNTPELQYGYTESLGDGRGITAGRAGFTTGTGDLYEVVKRYSDAVPDNPLQQYLPVLKKLKKRHSDSLEGLDGLYKDWYDAAHDARFREVQDSLVDQYYYFAALKFADEIGASYPLTLLALYDTAIQHGNGYDKDSLGALVKRAGKESGSKAITGINEENWLRAFLKCRRDTLLNPHNQATKEVWSHSVGRVDTLTNILNQGNLHLDTELTINPWGTEFQIIEARNGMNNSSGIDNQQPASGNDESNNSEAGSTPAASQGVTTPSHTESASTTITE